MANNRLFLLHRPSNKVAFLGKCMGGIWYTTTDVTEDLNKLFEQSTDNLGDFELLIEDASRSPKCREIHSLKEFEVIRTEYASITK